MEADISLQILTYISRQDGRIGFYQLVRRFGSPERDLPNLVKKLVADNLVSTVPGDAVIGQEIYVLTKRGREVLAGC
jgi:DNA-binding MarR family transcriptional regulator